MRAIKFEISFEKDAKRLTKKHYSTDKLTDVMDALETSDGELSGRFHDHALSGNWAGFRECHIETNMLLIYMLTETEIIFVRIGTHDDLFK